ncbi:MAG TPA: cardiolipin synthase [Pseudoclavibacter sp.]|nr:cardiolipin synthase [Pseudoclavibacter sp.]
MSIDWWVIFYAIIDLGVRIAAIIIVPRNRKPESALGWLLAIYFIPVIGILLFLLIGSPKLPRGRRKMQDEINAVIRRQAKAIDTQVPVITEPEWFEKVRTLKEELGAFPLVRGNSARLIHTYAESLEMMTEAVRRARTYVHVEFYILSLDDTTRPFFDALADAHRRGVMVRVLFDHWATSHKPFYRETIRFYKRAGIEYHRMLPLDLLHGKFQRPDLRNHRKLLVVDGEVGYMGSQNVIDASYNHRANLRRHLQWVDLMVELEGPIVASVDTIFLSDWYAETREIISDEIVLHGPVDAHTHLDAQMVPSGPGFSTENNLQLFLALLAQAETRVNIISPYFIPNEALLLALNAAISRGVSIDLFVSEESDQALVYHAQRSYYEALLRAGVRIWMFPKPYILHSKAMSVDGDVAVIGSSNMDLRSFGLNFEMSLLVRGRQIVDDLRDVEDHYRAVSTELTLEHWLQQPLRKVIWDNLARLTSALQ